MTVGELITRLSACDREAVVTSSPGGGVVFRITPTVNGFVILDAEPGTPENLRLMDHVAPKNRGMRDE